MTWRTVILSTGNSSGRELAKEAGLAWGGQDDVRFITIPVPPPEEAGIFDRLEGTPEERVAEGGELVRELQAALGECYGVIFRKWVKTLMKQDRSKRIRKLISRFVNHAQPANAHEHRIAEKFGLLYAAGKIAVDEGLLSEESFVPSSATIALYRRAITQEIHPGATLKEDLRALAQAVRSEERCPRIANGEILEIDDVAVVIGARCKHHGKRIIALRHDGLTAVISDPARADALLRHLQRKGALQPGHGGKAAQQFALPVRIHGKLVRRPRYLIVDAEAFAKAVGRVMARKPK